MVKLPQTGNVVLSGDAVHFRENYDADGVPAFNFDRAQMVASVERLKKIAANLKATVIIQHDARDIDKLPAFPASAKQVIYRCRRSAFRLPCDVKAIPIWEEAMSKLAGFGTFAALQEEQLSEKISRRILSGGQGMIVWWSIGSGVHVEPHSHANEQIVWMLKGKMEFRLGSEQRVCSGGDVVVIPGGTEHEAWFREDTEVIDFFAPPRADFLLGGKPAYMSEDSHTSNQSGADE